MVPSFTYLAESLVSLSPALRLRGFIALRFLWGGEAFQDARREFEKF